MVAITHPSLTNSQLSRSPATTDSGGLARALGTLRLWQERARQRRALAQLSERDLADFGASSADVYRELHTPFWRSPPPC